MPVQKAEALFNFNPTATVELELKKGDIVAVRRTSVGEGWWEGELNGKRGLFPSSYVKMLPKSASSSPRIDKLKAALTPGSIKKSVMEPPLTPGGSKKAFLEKLKTPLTPVTDKKPFIETPLTPGASKKAFMDTLLTPSIVTQDQVFDKEKSAELYVQGHSDISIAAGPRWDSFPPTLTVIIKNLHTQTRFSGVKHFTVFDVETKQLGTQVTRRYKSFLWFYDKLAELFPCLSLPPIPVKQLTGVEEHGIEARRRGLENFLNRIANHPVLGSTKLLHDFLTEKDDKDWKIGRQMSNIKLPRSAKKLFSAPIYSTVKYPPFNVPINQLASIEKFSRFSRLMELNVQALHQCCQQLCHSSGDMMSSVSYLGRDMQRMARGIQPIAKAQRRKVAAASSHPNLSISNGQSPFHLAALQRTPSFIEENDSEGELDTSFEWNWRDDSKFNCMMKQVYDLAGGMKKLSNLQQTFRDSMERNVLDSLSDYSGIIHTLPILVRLHEDAMEIYDASKEKDTKKEAEEVRQHCETLNNIILAEFDNFSNTMVDDFESIMLNILKDQAEFHQQLANEWNAMYQQYHTRKSSQQQQQTSERVTSSGKSFSFDKSGSFSGSFQSSRASSHYSEKGDIDKDSTLVQSLPAVTSKGAPIIPTYINVERMASKKRDSWEKISEDELKSPLDRSKSPGKTNLLNQAYNSSAQDSWENVSESDLKVPLDRSRTPAKTSTVKQEVYDSTNQVSEADIPKNGTSTGNIEIFESMIVHEAGGGDPLINKDENLEHEEVHSYANIDFVQVTGSTVLKPMFIPNPGSPKKPRKPMPIKRRNPSSDGELTATQESPTSSSSLESSSSPKVRAKIPLKPPPPAKVSKQAVSLPTLFSPGTYCVFPDSSECQVVGGSQITIDRSQNSGDRSQGASDWGQNSGGGGQSSSGENVKDTVTQGTLTSRHQLEERKPRSKNILSANPDKKQPILPPSLKHSPIKESKSHDHRGGNSTKIELSTKGAVSTVVIHNPTSHELKLSEPTTNIGHSNRPLVKSLSIPALPAAPASDNSHKNRDELMKKLSLRKHRIEQQLGINKSNPHRPNIANIAETPSERNSTVSTSSSLSEVVVAYTTKRPDGSLGNLSSSGAVKDIAETEVVLRTNPEDNNLSDYGIVEDTDGGSYLI